MIELILLIFFGIPLFYLAYTFGDPDFRKGGYEKRAKRDGFIPNEFEISQKYDEETWRSMLTEEELEIRKEYINSKEWKEQALEAGYIAENTYSNKADELIKLKSLLDDGVLTKSEFEEAKKELLTSSSNKEKKSNAYSCSRCGGTNFKRVRSTGGKIAAGVLAPKSRSECQTCGHKNQF